MGLVLWCRDVPLEVTDNEILIRAVTRFHLEKGKPAPQLFLNDNGVSVSRRSWITPTFAKIHAKLLVQRPENPYKGLAFISAQAVRNQKQGWDVKDSRSEFLAHADIVHPTLKRPAPREALDPRVAKAIRAQAKLIANAAKFVEDPVPDACQWRGGEG